MTGQKRIAQGAFAAALRMRKNAGYRLDEAICVYDLAEGLGIEVRFADIPSMEGMLYCSPEPVIIVSSLRPAGRRAFTCAHELGHFHYEDGTTIDDLVGKSDKAGYDPKEFIADCFAGALLMPKMAVEQAFAVRNWPVQNSTPSQIYIISGYFGVGYSTLINHLWKSLRLIPGSHAENLLKAGRRKAQSQALGGNPQIRRRLWTHIGKVGRLILRWESLCRWMGIRSTKEAAWKTWLCPGADTSIKPVIQGSAS